MTDKFKLEIELGNDAMITVDDVAAALRNIAHRLDTAGVGRGQRVGILDANGNTVGFFTWPK